MSDVVIVQTRIIVFTFVAAVILGVFAWFSVGHWITARAAERKDRERNALLRHLAGQPAESVRLVLEQIREDDARAREHAALWMQAHERGVRSTIPGARGGLLITAFGVGSAIFLYFVVPARAVWTVAAIPVLVGIVVTAFALRGKREP
jgi:hypothetical protein